MNLLAIPNDPLSAFHRNSPEDFLNEINPERFFDQVTFLNWKDKEDGVYAGIKSFSILSTERKKEAENLMKKLSEGEIPFSYPLFEHIFSSEKKDILRRSLEYNPDIVRAFNTHFAGELGKMVKDHLGIPLVISVNDISRITPVINEADSIVCISNALREKCINEYGSDPEKVTIIPDGINMNMFYPRDNGEISEFIDSKYDAKYKILSVGRIVPSKNIETLLQAIDLVKGELEDVTHLHLGLGKKESIENITSLRDEIGLNGTTYFLGGKKQSELPFYYSWADVYALPTLWEGLGRAQIESLACETPVVTTNYAPMTEVVTHGYNGLTSDPKNHEMLAEKIMQVLTNKPLRLRLKRNARASVMDKYNIQNEMAMHAANYKKVIEKSKNGR